MLGAELWLGMLNCRFLLLWRTYREATLLGPAPPWTPPWPSVTRHMFPWTTAWRLRTTYPRSWRRELLPEDGDPGTHKWTFQRRWRSVCVADLRTDKDMGDAREVLRQEGSEQECPQPSWGWNPINKNLFPSTLIVRSCVKVPYGWAPVCSVTTIQSNKTVLNEVKEKQALLEPFYGGKKTQPFWPPQYFTCIISFNPPNIPVSPYCFFDETEACPNCTT